VTVNDIMIYDNDNFGYILTGKYSVRRFNETLRKRWQLKVRKHD